MHEIVLCPGCGYYCDECFGSKAAEDAVLIAATEGTAVQLCVLCAKQLATELQEILK